MPKGEGYGTFEETFGSQDEQPYNSTSSFNMWDMSKKAKKAASFLRNTKLGNAAHGGRPFGKQVEMPHQLDGTTMKVPETSKVLVDTASQGGNQGSLTGDAMLRMANGMRAKFDENDQSWRRRKDLDQGTDHAFGKGF